MKEVDIWIEVLSKLDWMFKDEEVGPGNINKLLYWKENEYLYVYFDLTTSKVISIHIRRTSYDKVGKLNINKDIFYNLNRSLFREVKLSSIIKKN
jgi:hypothetical protein